MSAVKENEEPCTIPQRRDTQRKRETWIRDSVCLNPETRG